jgi:hypothetical protein
MACFMLDLSEATLIVLPTHIISMPGLTRAAMDTAGHVAWGLAASARQGETNAYAKERATQNVLLVCLCFFV